MVGSPSWSLSTNRETARDNELSRAQKNLAARENSAFVVNLDQGFYKKSSTGQRPTLHRKHFVAAELTFPHVSSGSLGQSGLPLYVSALARPHAVDVDDVHTLLSSWVVHPVMGGIVEQPSGNEMPAVLR